jgi:hypothetical protein
MKKHPFKKVPNAPQPLSFSVSRRVRFEEVDALGIVWHGRYPSYFEDVREALGDHYGIGYLDFFREKVAAPLRQLHFDYLKPLSLRESFTINAQLHWPEAAAWCWEDGEPLIAPGASGIGSVELANVMVYSGLLGQAIDLPMDGAAWEAKLNELIANSTHEKKTVEVSNEDFTASFRK